MQDISIADTFHTGPGPSQARVAVPQEAASDPTGFNSRLPGGDRHSLSLVPQMSGNETNAYVASLSP